MKQEIQDEQLIERYLLDDLSEDVREQVEERYFSEPDFLEQVRAIEAEMIEDCARGVLPAEKAERLEQHLLLSRPQQKKLRFANTLLRTVEQFEASAPAFPRTEQIAASWWDTARRFFHFQPGLTMTAAAAAALLLVGGLIFEVIRLRQRLEKSQQEQTALRQKEQNLQNTIAEQKNQIERLTGQPQIPPTGGKDDKEKEIAPPPPKTQFATFISPLLVMGPRAGQGLPELVISQKIEIVRLQLDYDGKSHPRFRAVLENANGEELWQKGGWQAQKFGSRKKIDVGLPASLLEDRTYTITLKAKASSGEEEDVGRYTFKVSRK